MECCKQQIHETFRPSETRVIIAGGGTGGHLFPGIAVADELVRAREDVKILFVVGQRRMESEILARHGYPSVSIPVEGLQGRGLLKGLGVLFRLPRSLLKSVAILRSHAPGVVLGMGAYSSGPLCLGARLMGIPTAIHEQNAYPGLTNRMLGHVVNRVFVSFEGTLPCFGAKKTSLTGNPIRQAFFSIQENARDVGPLRVLVMGGSQGARAVSEAFVEALGHLTREGVDMEVLHQSGEKDFERVQEDYGKRGLQGRVLPFIEDMAGALEQSDLVVSRAGATSLFELAAAGRPSILIPYPFATHHHQDANAQAMVQAGGARMILQKDLTGEVLARMIRGYAEDREALGIMARKARAFSRPQAARDMASALLGMARMRPADGCRAKGRGL